MADNALGRGLDALIKKPSKKESKEEDKKTKKVEIKPNFTLSEDKMEEIRKEVEKNPRISLWSAKSAACLRYLKKTTPEFSISNEASVILEDAIKEKYPDIWKLFEDL
ncbi:MAG: hypothetical protein BZ135_05070 [Methanosphaera sp. rholeuAM6]|nr:MAG: hypothetical protein BZ135_05070 [Methanosphaera sp. rholeuAM6]